MKNKWYENITLEQAQDAVMDEIILGRLAPLIYVVGEEVLVSLQGGARHSLNDMVFLCTPNFGVPVGRLVLEANLKDDEEKVMHVLRQSREIKGKKRDVQLGSAE